MNLSLIWNALQASERACTLCTSQHLRRSRTRTPWLARCLGLLLCRCETCWRLFLLPARLFHLEPTHAAE